MDEKKKEISRITHQELDVQKRLSFYAVVSFSLVKCLAYV